MRTPRERLLNRLVGTFFPEFLQMFAPELARRLEPGTLEIPGRAFTPRFSWDRGRRAGVLARGLFEGKALLVAVRVEHEAGRGFQRRMFELWFNLVEVLGPRVYPIALLCQGRCSARAWDRYGMKVAGKQILKFRYPLVELDRLNWRDYLRSDNPLASGLMAAMKVAPGERRVLKANCLRMLSDCRLEPEKSRLISTFIDVCLPLTAADERWVANWLIGFAQGRAEVRETVIRNLRASGADPELIRKVTGDR